MKPVTAKELLEKDKNLKVVKLGAIEDPQQMVWYAGKQDYSEEPIYTKTPPEEEKSGKWIVDQLLANDRGHYGPLEHVGLIMNVCGYPHDVMVQGRTHRVGVSFDVQSQRYTGERVLKVAAGELKPEDVFYVRPPGFYTNRKGKKYDWTEVDYQSELDEAIRSSERYAQKYKNGVSEEHARQSLYSGIRQHFVVSFNLRSVLHFLDLRSKLDAQLEIQAACEQMCPIIKEWAPEVWDYYETKRLHRAKLSP
jgi:thymidylate synthase (FAD)